MKRLWKLYCSPEIADRGGDLSKTWYVFYYFRIPDTFNFKRFRLTGNINRYHTKTERAEAARLIRAEMEQMLREGYNPFSEETLLAVHPGMSFNDAVKYFDEHHIKHTGDRSKQNFKWTMRMVRAELGDYTPVSSITTNTIRDALNKIQKKHNHSNRTRNNLLQSLHTLFNFLCNDEDVKLKENPCKFVKDLPVGDSTQNIPASDEEFERIVNHLYQNNKHLLLAMSFILYLSLRTNELGKIQRKQIVKYKDHLAITLTGSQMKNKKARLQLIPPDLETLMAELDIVNLPADHYLFSYGMKPNELPMPSFRNRAAAIWKKEVKDVLKIKAGLYASKHYQATSLASRGIDERLIQKWADHQDVKVTRQYIRGNVPLIPVEMMDDLVRLPVYEQKVKDLS